MFRLNWPLTALLRLCGVPGVLDFTAKLGVERLVAGMIVVLSNCRSPAVACDTAFHGARQVELKPYAVCMQCLGGLAYVAGYACRKIAS